MASEIRSAQKLRGIDGPTASAERMRWQDDDWCGGRSMVRNCHWVMHFFHALIYTNMYVRYGFVHKWWYLVPTNRPIIANRKTTSPFAAQEDHQFGQIHIVCMYIYIICVHPWSICIYTLYTHTGIYTYTYIVYKTYAHKMCTPQNSCFAQQDRSFLDSWRVPALAEPFTFTYKLPLCTFHLSHLSTLSTFP